VLKRTSKGPPLIEAGVSLILSFAVSAIDASSLLQTAAKRSTKKVRERIVTGRFVAYEVGVQRANGLCRQMLVVNTKKGRDRELMGEYILVRYENTCMKLIPERVLKRKNLWRLPLTRHVECDQPFRELLYVEQISPAGEISRIPRLQRVSGREAARIPINETLPCYALRASWYDRKY
jgi:hypothetical protein